MSHLKSLGLQLSEFKKKCNALAIKLKCNINQWFPTINISFKAWYSTQSTQSNIRFWTCVFLSYNGSCLWPQTYGLKHPANNYQHRQHWLSLCHHIFLVPTKLPELAGCGGDRYCCNEGIGNIYWPIT